MKSQFVLATISVVVPSLVLLYSHGTLLYLTCRRGEGTT